MKYKSITTTKNYHVGTTIPRPDRKSYGKASPWQRIALHRSNECIDGISTLLGAHFPHSGREELVRAFDEVSPYSNCDILGGVFHPFNPARLAIGVGIFTHPFSPMKVKQF